MQAKIYAAPTEEPVSLLDLKEHCGIVGDDQDALLEALITSARQYAESYTRRALVTQTWDYYRDFWPDGDYFELPFGQLQSVTSVKYKDSDGTETTMTVTTEYLVDANSDPGRIVLPYGENWPSFTAYPVNPIVVRFVCGFGAASSVPAAIRTAIKMLAAETYEIREVSVIGRMVTPTNIVENLLWPYRLWGEF